MGSELPEIGRESFLRRLRTCAPEAIESEAEQLEALPSLDPRQEILLTHDVLPSGTRAEFQQVSIKNAEAADVF